jgi:hypothetical protein
MWGDMTRDDEYRRKAEECRLAAESAARPEVKAEWLKLAGDWLKLVENAERSRLGGRTRSARTEKNDEP